MTREVRQAQSWKVHGTPDDNPGMAGLALVSGGSTIKKQP